MVARIAILAMLALAGCTTAKGGFCLGGPHRPSAATVDAMTDAEIERALARLETGRKLCGWRQ